MSTIIDDGVEFVTIWDGSHHGTDADLLRDIPVPFYVPPPRQELPEEETPALVTERIMVLLLEQPEWTTKALRVELDVPGTKMHAALQSLRRQGRTVHPVNGIVRLVRPSVAA
jgi:hypothetical protein